MQFKRRLVAIQSINDLIRPGGRLYEQRNIAWEMLNEIPGVSCVKPEGAMYCFPRLDLTFCQSKMMKS